MPREEVGAAVDVAFTRYDVPELAADPWGMAVEPIVGVWAPLATKVCAGASPTSEAGHEPDISSGSLPDCRCAACPTADLDAYRRGTRGRPG